MSADTGAYEVRFLDCCAPLPYGGTLDASYKAWVYRDGEIYWELRRLLKCRAREGVAVLVHRFVKDQRSLWQTEFEAFGCADRALVSSFNAARANNDLVSMEDHLTRQEFSIHTSAMLCLMILWCKQARVHELRDKYRALAVGFLQRTAGNIEDIKQKLTKLLKESAPYCDSSVPFDTCCKHQEAVIELLGQGRGWDGVLDAVLMVRSLHDICRACREVSGRFLRDLAGSIDRKLREDAPILNTKKDIRHRPLLEAKTKRMRIDEDYKYDATVTRMHDRSVPNTGRALRGDGLGVAPAVGRRWEAEICLEHQAAMRMSFATTRVTHVTEDGSRLGDPAEETVIYLAWSADTDIAGVPPPQVAVIS